MGGGGHPSERVVLPDSLELVFSPSVSDTGHDYLGELYQTLDDAQRRADPSGTHLCSDPDPAGVTTGTPELMWNGADGVYNTECGALLE